MYNIWNSDAFFTFFRLFLYLEYCKNCNTRQPLSFFQKISISNLEHKNYGLEFSLCVTSSVIISFYNIMQIQSLKVTILLFCKTRPLTKKPINIKLQLQIEILLTIHTIYSPKIKVSFFKIITKIITIQCFSEMLNNSSFQWPKYFFSPRSIFKLEHNK